ncbi:cell surface protein [Brachyspira aalborgi]|uniref:Cell surface protein n=1 Tax=Brachyspira aalborgi TaxID=29522 RepID=A0A5C8CHQ5_9SPIR|nr:cell surface protein [Brachyspira aalborgi]TXJ12358.1 cell surface protein [Brachyspira aalborgi]
MRKIFLTAIALLSMASASVFGMYGVDSGWIDFLTHGNQFRARMQQLGFTLGNDTIKGTFGFNNNAGYGGVYGSLLSTTDGMYYDFKPSISMGLGYTSSLISVGVGYNVTIGPRVNKYNGKAEQKLVQQAAHTPVLVLNALDNAFRMAIPIQVYAFNDKTPDGTKTSINLVSVDSQFRYYTGLDMLPQIRLYLRYGGGNYKVGTQSEKIGETFGFDFRLYFGSMVEEVALQPYVKLVYNGALGKYHKNTRIEAVSVLTTGNFNIPNNLQLAKSAWNLNLVAGLGLTANSDIVSLYLEPSLGLKVTQAGSTDKNAKEVYSLGYGVYAEIYITPLKNLEWYFEAELGNLESTGSTLPEDPATIPVDVSVSRNSLGFNATTGITWYLPAL